jgi:putative flippase GtrA
MFQRITSRAKASQQVRFVFVGVLNTAFSYSIYAFFLFVGVNYQLSNFLALVFGILFSFKTQGSLVFNNSNNKLLGRFVLSWVIIYLGTISVISQFMTLGLNAYWAGALALPFSVALSYVTQKYFVFRKSKSS